MASIIKSMLLEGENRMTDLFDYAKKAKAEGMERVDNHADDEWKRVMAEMVIKTAREMHRFTTDDVVDRFNELPDPPTTHDKRAMGPVMMRAAKSGVCCKAPVAPIMSRRASLHASPRQVWDSLLYSGQAH
jgi:hypothetical protein